MKRYFHTTNDVNNPRGGGELRMRICIGSDI